MLPPAWVDPAVLRPLEPGDPHDVGGYQVLGLLGTGGMGRVLLARTQSGRPLAIKMVRPEYATDPEFRRRFKQEITAAQQVQHRRVAAVVDAAADAPHPWLATAYVPGPSLAQAIGQWGPLPVETVLVLATGAAAALGAIHEAGIVHRDLKPSNVLLAPDGPVIIDFGIARATESTPLTRTGLRIGSPQFMSPEQALGDPAGPASDVFALGSLIFFAATGRAPFGDGPDTAVLYRIVHEEPRLDGCPQQFQTLVTRCLAKDPVERPSIEEFIRAVTPEAESGPPHASGTATEIWLPPALTKILPMYEARQPATSPGAPPQPAQQPQRAVPLPPLWHRGTRSRRHSLIGAAVGALLVMSLIGVVASRGTHATPAIGAGGASGAQTTSTAPETPTPPPHAGPQSYRGRGDKILRIKHGDGLWLATLTHTGSSNFIVTALDSAGQRGGSLVNEIAGYEGTVLLNTEEGSNTSALQIKADGEWTIDLKPPSSARRWIGTQISGKSDEVLALDTPSSGLVTMNLTHTGSSNFIVHGYTADSSEILVNQIGHYRGEVALPDGTFLITIHADGRWTLTTS